MVVGEYWELEGRARELAALSAHLNAATARWLDQALALRRDGMAVGDDFGRWLAWRCGISTCEAREFLRVGEALQELPLVRAAFERGELTFCKLRALTRVATPASEKGLLDLAGGLTASQLERALRVFRRYRTDEAADSHKLEYVDYHWEDDGSLILRARVPAEDGVVLVKALDAARERVRVDHRAGVEHGAPQRRDLDVEALLELASGSLDRGVEQTGSSDPVRLVVHVDAAALTAEGAGRCELEDGPGISPETARRLGCDAEHVASLERNGLPVSVGRRRRTVPPRLRRVLEARDHGACCWPGCDRRRHLAAHHRRHWAHGGETSLDNLLLLCFHHHRLVHEGGYAIEDGAAGELRFRNRYGLLCLSASRPPPGNSEQLVSDNTEAGLVLDGETNRNGEGERMDLPLTVDVISEIVGPP